MQKKALIRTFILLFGTILTSCQTTKYVPDGSYLLNKLEIKCDQKDIKAYDLKTYLRQNPNPKLFDFIPFNLGLYSLSSPDTALWINRFLRKIGDEPVIYDPEMTTASEEELKKYMGNKGYFNAKVSSETTFKKKKAKVKFKIQAGEPYTINSYKYAIKDSAILNLVLADSAKSLIRIGKKFDADVLESERVRITKILKNNGYYEFDKDYISVLADSTLGNHTVNLALLIKPVKRIVGKNQYETETHQPYTIRNVTFYELSDIEDINNTTLQDKLKESSYKTVHLYTNTRLTRPKALYRNSQIEPNSLYNESKVDKTYSKLSGLNTFKYQNIIFKRTEDSTKHELDCNIILTPDKFQSISAQIDGTNNEGDFGLAGMVKYTHGNLFKGGEQFSLSIRGGNESLITKRSIWDFSTEASLKFPILLCPFLNINYLRNNSTNTEIYMNFSYQTRKDYSRIIVGTGIRYLWTGKKNISHQFDLVDFNYVYLPFMSDEFKQTIKSSILQYSYEDHFIMRTGYSISYTNKKLNENTNNYSIRAAVETSGNLMYGICVAANTPKNESGSYLAGKIPFAQYAKVDFDYCYRLVADEKNTIAFHIGLGVGVPYLNSHTLPFEKRYYGGGANSVRGWSARSLGPGNYAATDNIDYMKQSGDINLNMNIEYRTKLFWKLELAAFLDAGNIWTLQDEGQAEGQFKFDRFYKQIAFGYGIGLRLNFDFFVVRLDWGLKAFDPAQEKGKQWRFVPGWNITKDTALHFAVGFPF